eukprot:NODE_507_length_6688_cov_1.276673.p4 type:complete len:283 gc:universal NODE_507_length_6688_cov_1.276673:4067-4915(+)
MEFSNEIYDLYLRSKEVEEFHSSTLEENQRLRTELDEVKSALAHSKSVSSKLKELSIMLLKFVPAESQGKLQQILTQNVGDDLLSPKSTGDDSENQSEESTRVDIEDLNDLLEIKPAKAKIIETSKPEPIRLIGSDELDNDITIVENDDIVLLKKDTPTAFSRLIEGSRKVNWKKAERVLTEKENDNQTLSKRKQQFRKVKSGTFTNKKHKCEEKINEPVRKKEERAKLNGHHQGCCENYYNAINDEDQVDHHVHDISRHRSKYTEPNTPPGFWDTTFPPTQ